MILRWFYVNALRQPLNTELRHVGVEQESASLSRCFLPCHLICHLERVCIALAFPGYANSPLAMYIFTFWGHWFTNRGLSERASDDGALSRRQAFNEREGGEQRRWREN